MKKLFTLLLVVIGGVVESGAATVIHLLPGIWDAANDTERYALYLVWNDNGEQNKWVDFTPGDFNAWDVTIDDDHTYSKMVLCRMNGNTSENNWSNKWNQTDDITTIPTSETWYEVKNWDGDNYDASTKSKTIYIQERGTSSGTPKFYCWDGSVEYNGAYPGYQLKSKEIDAETWYGFTTIKASTAIINNNGDYNKTDNISLPGSDVYYFYYPDSKSYAETESKFVSGTLKYATFGSTNKLYFGFLPTNVTASLVNVENGSLQLTPFTGDLIAGEGVLLENETGSDITLHIPVATSTPSSNTNQLVAITTAQLLEQTSGSTKYVLTNKKADGTTGDVAFYKVNSSGSYVNSGTAYLDVPEAVSGAREFFALDSETTSINAISNSHQTVDNCFNLAGQRVAQPKKGLYIKNGKKVVIK